MSEQTDGASIGLLAIDVPIRATEAIRRCMLGGRLEFVQEILELLAKIMRALSASAFPPNEHSPSHTPSAIVLMKISSLSRLVAGVAGFAGCCVPPDLAARARARSISSIYVSSAL